jgi:hypothetical protein
MKNLILSATAALLLAGFTFPAFADASSTTESDSFSAAEFFAERAGELGARSKLGAPVPHQMNAPVPYYRASISRTAPPAGGVDSLTHDSAEYDE